MKLAHTDVGFTQKDKTHLETGNWVGGEWCISIKHITCNVLTNVKWETNRNIYPFCQIYQWWLIFIWNNDSSQLHWFFLFFPYGNDYLFAVFLINCCYDLKYWPYLISKECKKCSVQLKGTPRCCILLTQVYLKIIRS